VARKGIPVLVIPDPMRNWGTCYKANYLAIFGPNLTHLVDAWEYKEARALTDTFPMAYAAQERTFEWLLANPNPSLTETHCKLLAF
jgi:hypothetical protein